MLRAALAGFGLTFVPEDLVPAMSVLSTLFQDFAARLCSPQFLINAHHSDHPAAFSHCRKLPLPALVAIMLTGMRMSI
jgi:hypothetical protein